MNPTNSAPYAQEIRDAIGRALVQSSFGREFLPESALTKIVEGIDFGRLMPGASEDLVSFIKTKAAKVFLAALLSLDHLSGPSLVKVTKSFQKNRFSDNNLPVKDITKRGRCLHPDSYVRCRCKKCSRACKATCPHEPALNSFHLREWSRSSFHVFFNMQWVFLAPVLKMHDIQVLQNELLKETILPFTWHDRKPRRGHFSNVFHAKLHVAHQTEYAPNETECLEVALKELKPVLIEETDYNAEHSWRLEVTALNELGKLKDDHLIRPIAAFKWHSTHYIVFPWADGGTLRNFWAEAGDAHLGLNKQRVREFLEQLLGLADALRKLHGTNTRTATALAEADMKSSTPPRNGSPSFNTESQPYPFKPGGPGDDAPLGTDSNENEDGDVRHWRHGDLKPENILVFRDSTWLGTLKIADLGLAKQHQFATESRDQATSTTHETLHYKAPEAVTHRQEPRSRRYDVWSTGCIILESIIWLLYGSEGLDRFYQESKRLKDRTRQTLYFTTSCRPADGGTELVASVSEIAMHWITEILEKDPECQRYTAIRQLLELIRDRLLVVEIPRRSKPREAAYRATSGELHEELKTIMETVMQDDDYLFTDTDRRNVKAPSPFHMPDTIISEPKTSKPQEYLAVNNSLTLNTSRNALVSLLNDSTSELFQSLTLDNVWEFSEDDMIYRRIMETNGFNTASIFPELTVPKSHCERCLALDFTRFGLIATEQIPSLESGATFCALCQLLLLKFSTSSRVIADIWRVKGGITNRDGGTPILSLYRAPSVGTSSHGQAGIPIGFPKLPDISSNTYFETLRQWLKDCDNNHMGCHLEDSESALATLPTRLIDVEERDSPYVRLLETQHSTVQVPHLRYVALSHPWGDKAKHSHYCTTRENIAHHKAGIAINILPPTFQDAIQATRQLRVRYLWIDSLCIVQGKDGDFEDEATHMETVFSSAYCVIAATCASGTSSGFLKSRPDRNIVKMERPGEAPLYFCDAINNFQQDVIEGTLSQRGWVLQERALARRTIHFANNQTYWECGEAALLGDPKFPRVATESSKGGQIRLYELLYKQYSRLQFSRSYDRPLAIAGLEQRLIRAFNTQGGYGVFARYFGRGLLWQRDVTMAPSAMKPIPFPASQKYAVPLWSWMAYEGAITFMDLPFREIDWEEKEIRSPWSPPSPGMQSSSSSRSIYSSNANWHTAKTKERIDLTAIARDFSAAADKHIVYDGGDRPEGRIVKCVIVGRRKMKTVVDHRRIHYVLVIAQKGGAGYTAGYERIGVGALPGSTLDLDGSGLQVQVF
ncbi:HET-domain-containing protein [Xylaria palmicola]|nr:HET-domain-containing protein [Xylaria palmicola]